MVYRLSKETLGRIENSIKIINIEANNIEEVQEFLNKNKLEYIRYSNFSNTVYYK